jgi:hypothetical protein
MNEKKSMDVKDLLPAVLTSFHKVGRYALILFVVFLAIIYSVILYRVYTLSTAEPSSEAISQAGTPHINADVVNQLLELKDNNVQVQTLFNDARDNPFQE